MKKAVSILSIALIASIAITSCKKSSTNNSIVGKWKLTSASIASYDSTTTPITKTSQDTTLTGNTTQVQFNADNSYTLLDSIGDPTPQVGTYIFANDTLSIISPTASKIHASVSGNALSLQQSNVSSHTLSVFSENFTRQ